MAPRLRRDQRIRADDGRRWHSDSEVLSAYNSGGADPPVQGAHHQSAQTLEAFLRGRRNRSRWAEYETAIEDMMEKTSTKPAPWYLVPANDKLHGRLAMFTILIDVLGKGQNLKPRPLDPKVAEMAKQLFDFKLN